LLMSREREVNYSVCITRCNKQKWITCWKADKWICSSRGEGRESLKLDCIPWGMWGGFILVSPTLTVFQ
jgi:hypothetical protein